MRSGERWRERNVSVRKVGDARDRVEDGAVARVEAREVLEVCVHAVLRDELGGLERVVLLDRRATRRRVALALHEDARQPRRVRPEVLLQYTSKYRTVPVSAQLYTHCTL